MIYWNEIRGRKKQKSWADRGSAIKYAAPSRRRALVGGPPARPQPARSPRAAAHHVVNKKKKKKKAGQRSGWRPTLPRSITSFFERVTPEKAAELAAERMEDQISA